MELICLICMYAALHALCERRADDTELAPLALGCEEPLLSTGLTVKIQIRA